MRFDPVAFSKYFDRFAWSFQLVETSLSTFVDC